MRALLLVLAACGSAAAPATPQPTGDGAILAREPCTTFTDQAAFDSAIKAYYEKDIVKAGLDAELAARPLTTIFTAADREALVSAAASGRCEKVTYRSDGLRVRGFLVKPSAPGPHPVVIYLRGGSREFGKIEPATLLTLVALADAGFVVAATQYRGVDGGDGKDEFGGAELRDVFSLVPLAAQVPGADTKRLFLLGGSRGGMEGLLALRKGLPVKAAAFRAPLVDVWDSLQRRPELEEQYRATMPDYDARKENHLLERSAIKHVAEFRTPILLLHGRQDWRVSVESVQAFADALKAAGKPHKLVVYEREEHQLVLHRREWIAEVVAWFRAHGR